MSNSIYDDKRFGMGSHNGDSDESKQDDSSNDDVVEAASEKEEMDAEHFLELVSRMRGMMPQSDDDDEDEDDEEDSGMSADDYHNKAVDHARHGNNKQAMEVCMQGLQHFPLNIDLLADTVKYASESGDMVTARKHYTILKKSVPFSRWNWRAFTFSFDFLLEDDPIENETECRTIVSNYRKYLPHEEKSCVAESELETALGNMERSMTVLQSAIRTYANASQCALRLADMQLERGLYEDVIVTANYGIAASAEVQPSINIPYMYYIRTLAKDHILHKKECNQEPITKDELAELTNEYELLISEFPELMRYARTIKMRAKMLKFVKAS